MGSLWCRKRSSTALRKKWSNKSTMMMTRMKKKNQKKKKRKRKKVKKRDKLNLKRSLKANRSNLESLWLLLRRRKR